MVLHEITVISITIITSDAVGSVLNQTTEPKRQQPNRLFLKTNRFSLLFIFKLFLNFFF